MMSNVGAAFRRPFSRPALQREWDQFRLLSRDSVRRLLDSILVSRDADPMLFALWFTTLAVTPPTLVAMRKTIQYPFLQKAPLEVIEQISTADRSFFIVYGMLATALLASLTWDALFPDRHGSGNRRRAASAAEDTGGRTPGRRDDDRHRVRGRRQPAGGDHLQPRVRVPPAPGRAASCACRARRDDHDGVRVYVPGADVAAGTGRDLRRRAHRRSAGAGPAVRHHRAAGRDLSISARGAARHHRRDAGGTRLVRMGPAGLVRRVVHLDGRGHQLPQRSHRQGGRGDGRGHRADRPRQPAPRGLDGPARSRGAHDRARQRIGPPRAADRPAVGTRTRRAQHVRVRRGESGAESPAHDPAGHAISVWRLPSAC